MIKYLKSGAGFTIIELLIVVALITIIASISFLGLSNYRGSQSLKQTANELVSVIKEVQNRSLTQRDGKQWGIRFTNATSGPQNYEIFSGASYSTSTVDRKYSLGRGMKFGEPAAGFSVDEIFAAITGQLSSTKIISLNTGRTEGFTSDIILYPRGKTTVRHENGLVGYWHLDENTSTMAYDASGMSNSGSLMSSPTWQSVSSCKAGNCLGFSGSNYVKATSSASLNINGNAITVTAWFYRTAVADFQRVVGKYYYSGGNFGSWLMFFTASSTNNINCQFNIGGGWPSVSTPTAVGLNQWTFAACVYNGSRLYAYLNNASSSASQSGNLAQSNYPLAIAATSDGTSVQNYFSGRIDEVRIYNRALSEMEVANIYNDLK